MVLGLSLVWRSWWVALGGIPISWPCYFVHDGVARMRASPPLKVGVPSFGSLYILTLVFGPLSPKR